LLLAPPAYNTYTAGAGGGQLHDILVVGDEVVHRHGTCFVSHDLFHGKNVLRVINYILLTANGDGEFHTHSPRGSINCIYLTQNVNNFFKKVFF